MNPILLIFIPAILTCFVVVSCTLSFKNISTHGTATDLVDEKEDASPTISPDVNLNKM